MIAPRGSCASNGVGGALVKRANIVNVRLSEDTFKSDKNAVVNVVASEVVGWKVTCCQRYKSTRFQRRGVH